MSKARKLRRMRAWARYFNHYSHIPDVRIGGLGAVRAIGLFDTSWVIIRHSRKPCGYGYPGYPPLQETYFGSGIYE